MAGQARVEQMNVPEQTQDCGCGCGGALCGTAGQDCGCGCGGLASGGERQEVVFVGSLPDRDTGVLSNKQCNCGCGCSD